MIGETTNVQRRINNNGNACRELGLVMNCVEAAGRESLRLNTLQ